MLMASSDATILPLGLTYCKPKYGGTLYLTFNDDIKNTNKSYRGQAVGKLSNSEDLVPVKYNQKFQFNECFASDWTRAGQSFGQVELIDSEKTNTVITANIFSSSAGGKLLRLYQPSLVINELLERQWFEATYFPKKANKPIVTLQLRGKPNDQNGNFNLPYATIDHYYPDPHIYAKPASSKANITLTLYDVAIFN
jgi:hypothetical protein